MIRYIGYVLVLLLALPARGQSLTGIWQGVETDEEEPGATWPAELRLQQGKGGGLFGVLYQEATGRPGVSVTFEVRAARAAAGLRLEHVRKLSETGRTLFSYWCEGYISLTYDPQQEKLTGRATYRPIGDCDAGSFTLYRIKLKSAATVPAGAETTLRVSGRDVTWYADADRKQPLATGNTYRTRLSKPTTFYLTQGYYATGQSAVVPITVNVARSSAPVAARPAPIELLRPVQVPVEVDTTSLAPAPPPAPALITTTPVALPTVLFRLGTAELLPESRPALERLAAELQARPALRILVAGHTDRIGEPQKNQVLSEQRAEAVKADLVQAGVAADRISTIGYGDARPLHPSPDARNRRVEVQEVP
ncbi:OmpA family protein [Hymenobacter weizhouensis]|uniref:OmpA family protein n=1 Tax=Hymenobacter sp. YIM 151500-1 TaxID=2987689 RepID=UPI0022276BBC|nr:OmpA family protein [Hymenobacter sp. YIM 151500-1]UYZ64203.1 OmpA family protein [Hymenobacter sp. YIM 151500-1]